MFKFEEIIKKYNYDEQLSEFLYKVYIELVRYYGNEEIIYNAFLNTEIKSTSNIYEYLKENDMIDENTLVTESDLKRSTGIYTSKPLIVSENNKYKIIDIKRTVLVKDFDIKSTTKKATLIHELCHMAKSYENEYTVKGNILVNSSGLIERHYKLTGDKEVQKELIIEKGIGLEEGFTTIAEEQITRNIVDEKYHQSGYGPVYTLSNILTEYINENLIRYSELHHDRELLYEKINNYEEIENLSDLAYKLNLEMYAKAFDERELENIKNAILNIMKEYKESLSKEKGRVK